MLKISHRRAHITRDPPPFANCINIVNNMFDSGNSKHPYDSNPNKIPVSDRNTQVLNNLEKAKQICKRKEKIKTKKINKSTIPS